jgi:hypothetical protein
MTVNGIQVPGWAVAAIMVAASLIGVGVGLGAKLEAQAQRDVNVNYRLCRIERALGVEPWQGCPTPAWETKR